jgi:5-formyltetrahydrofolate cyclo-ligase
MSARDGLQGDARLRSTAAITEACDAIIANARPDSVAGYVAIRSEFDPKSVLDHARAAGAIIALPIVVGRPGLVFRRFEIGQDLVPGGFGTLVPTSDAPEIVPSLILVPLLGFDRNGMRLGYGKGHYDSTLAGFAERGISPTLVGVAFSVQEVERIPHEPHDVRLDCIVTEKETLLFRQEAF